MSFPKDDNELDKALAEAFASPPEADFDAWRQQHPEAVACLNPQKIGVQIRRRRTMNRILVFAAAAIVLACVCLGLTTFDTKGHGTSAFAQAVEQIQKAKTITWKVYFYEHVTSKDGKRTWRKTEIMECAYRAPGFHREVRFDDKGQVESVEINDWTQGRGLRYSPSSKKATLLEGTPCSAPSSPFSYYLAKLNESNLQWIGKRKIATGEVNIFRHAFRDHLNERDWSLDFWIDAKTKQLVAVYQPGADIFDPDTDPMLKNSPEKERSITKMMGGGWLDIHFDVALDDSLFRLEPPEGYTVDVEKRLRITEKEMIDYFGILADFNDKMFPDQPFPYPFNLMSKINHALKKPENELTVAERKFLKTDERYLSRSPILIFFENDPKDVVEKSFRYLGKGVKLGDKDRIVCWYKLKNAKDPNTYRVLYGDLSVRDVAPEDLPLPVEP